MAEEDEFVDDWTRAISNPHVRKSMSPYGEEELTVEQARKVLSPRRNISDEDVRALLRTPDRERRRKQLALVRKAVSRIPLNLEVKEGIVRGVSAKLDGYSLWRGLTKKKAIGYLIYQYLMATSGLTPREAVVMLAKAGFRGLKGSSVQINVVTKDPSKIKIVAHNSVYRRVKWHKGPGESYEFWFRPVLADADKRLSMKLRIDGPGVISPNQTRRVKRVSDSKVTVSLDPSGSFEFFKVAEMSSTRPDLNEVLVSKPNEALRRFDPSKMPITVDLYKQLDANCWLALVKSYRVLFDKKTREQEGRRPSTLAREALKESDRLVFDTLKPNQKRAIRDYIDRKYAASVTSRDLNIVGIRGLVVPSEIDSRNFRT